MADLHFLLLIMATIEEGGYFPADNEVEKYIAQFNDEYPRFIEMRDNLTRTILSINQSNLAPDSIWYRKSNYFTLVCELIWSGKQIEDLIEDLNAFEVNVLENKSSDRSTNEFAIYYANMYAGTNSRNARVKRSEILKANTNIASS
jgi:hypothetical protein